MALVKGFFSQALASDKHPLNDQWQIALIGYRPIEKDRKHL